MLVASVAATPAQAAQPSGADSGPSSRQARADLRKTFAEAERAQAEAGKIGRDSEWQARLLSYLAPILTAAAAAGGVFLSVRKAGVDRRDAIEREARQREDADRASEIERFDERFANAVAGLSSAKPGEESGAAVLVASMVREKREALSSQALQLLLVSLQAEHDEACERLLKNALEWFARAAPQRLVGSSDHVPVGGLAHVRASYLDLSGLDLPGLDIAFASLRKANFSKAGLRKSKALRAELEKARFNEADLTEAAWSKVKAGGARFRSACLTHANLHQADLGAANFHGADLSRTNLRFANLKGADFRSASLEKADLYGAKLDDRALSSVLEAAHWETATFGDDAERRLKALARERSGRQAL